MTESTTAATPPSTRTQRIVILGGGFAGVTTAQELTRRLRSQGRLAGRRRPAGNVPDGPAALPRVSVTLINRDNYFVFQPLLADIISGAIETTHVVVPLRRMLPGADVEVGQVEAIDPAAREVHVRRRLGGAPFTVGYDALVVALGSVTDFGAVPGMAEYALGVRSLGDAFYLAESALSMLEEAAHEEDPERQRAAPDVRRGRWGIDRRGGCGRASGSPTHGAPDVCDATGADGRPRSQPCTRPVRVRGTSRPACPRNLSRAGVQLVLKERLARVEADRVELDDGTTIATATVVSTVGNAPHPVVARLGPALDDRGWIRPDATFAVPGLDRIWALGDCASILDPHTGRPMPATPQHAVREGPHAARNILAVLDGGRPLPFDYGQQGMLVSLGRFKGVGEVRGIKVSGLVAWFLWRTYYLLRLPSRERRLRVALRLGARAVPGTRRRRDQHASQPHVSLARRSARCRASPSQSEREARRQTSWCSDCLNGCRLRRGTWGRRASPPRTNVSTAAQARSRSTPVPTDAPGDTTCRCIDRAVAAPPRRARLRHRRGSGTRSARPGGSRAWAR